MIPQETIEQVAAATDIVEVINGYVPLKRAGSTWKACCPFHREKSPSFTVNPARQIFKCFGCGAGGGVFKFVTMFVNIDFPSAVRMLAERAGVAIVEEYSGDAEQARTAGQTRRRLLALHAEGADWFHRKLMKSPEAQHARDYLKARGLTGEVATRWKLGYAPDTWDSCLKWASERGYRREELVQSGLVKPRDEDDDGSGRGGVYDRFRDRLMFPISNEVGEVIGFSGRVLSAEAKGAKYVNSPESPIFTKGKVLFGLHMSKRAVLDRKFAIVCEGQIDLITAFEAGVQNVLAPQGTAFTKMQADILKRHADEVVLCFDSDAAGQQAAERSLPALLEANVTVRVATMPPGEDPDSLIRTQGPEAFQARIKAARDFFDFQIDRLSKTFDLNTAKGKSQFSRKMAESVALVNDNVLREAVVAKVSQRLEISPQFLYALLRRQTVSAKNRSTVDLTGNNVPAEVEGDADAESFEKPPQVVKDLLKVALESEEARHWLHAQPWEEVLPRISGTDLLVQLLSSHVNQGDHVIRQFIDELTGLGAEFVSGLIFDSHKGSRPFPQPMIAVRDYWVHLEKMILEERVLGIASRQKQPGVTAEENNDMLKELLDLNQRLKEIARL